MVFSGDRRAFNAVRWSSISQVSEIGPDSALFSRALRVTFSAAAWEWGKCSGKKQRKCRGKPHVGMEVMPDKIERMKETYWPSRS